MHKNKKYGVDFRLAVVQKVLSGKQSLESISQGLGIQPSMIKRWVSFYRRYGIDGILPIRNAYTANFKVKVIEEMRNKSLSFTQTCLHFKIPSIATLINWVKIYDCQGAEGLRNITIGRPSTMPRKPKKQLSKEEQLLEELADLRAENAYLKKLHALIQSETEKEKKRKSSRN